MTSGNAAVTKIGIITRTVIKEPPRDRRGANPASPADQARPARAVRVRPAAKEERAALAHVMHLAAASVLTRRNAKDGAGS